MFHHINRKWASGRECEWVGTERGARLSYGTAWAVSPSPPLSPYVPLSWQTATALLVSFRLHLVTWITVENLLILQPVPAFGWVESPPRDNVI
jgi:hypothetical protein